MPYKEEKAWGIKAMKPSRRFISGVLAVCVSAALLVAGCGRQESSRNVLKEIDAEINQLQMGGNQGESSKGDRNSPDIVRVYMPKPAAKGYRYSRNGQQVSPEDSYKAVNDLMQGASPIKAKFEWMDVGDMAKKIYTDEDPRSNEYDIAVLDRDTVDSLFLELYKKGKLLELTDVLPKYAPSLYSRSSKDELKLGMIDGKLVGIPVNIPELSRNYAIIRDDLRKKYDIPPISKLEDLEVYCRTIKEKEPKIMPLYMGQEDSMTMFSFAKDYIILDKELQLVYKRNQKEIKVAAWERTPEYRELEKKFRQWYKDFYINYRDVVYNSHVDMDSLDKEQTIEQGKSAAILTKNGVDIKLYEARAKSFGFNEIELKAYPLYPQKAPVREGKTRGIMVIYAKSPHPELALQLLEEIHSDKEIYEQLQKVMLSGQGAEFFLDPELDRKSFEERMTDGNEKAEMPPHAGFLMEKSEINDLMDRRVIQKRFAANAIGDEVPNDEQLSSYIEEQAKEGAESLVQAVQKQLDLWVQKTNRGY